MPKPIEIGQIANRFDVNISTLRVFNNQIGRLAEEHDKKTTEQQNHEIARIMGISIDELDQIKDLSKEDFQGALSTQKGIEHENTQQIILSEEQTSVVQKIAHVDNSEFLMKSIRFFRASRKTVPMQAFILRRSALITLASHFEYLITELIHLYYSLYPQALPSEERVLSLADLREIGSVEDAENYLIAREIDALLRDTLEKQLEYFSKRPKVNLDALAQYKNRLIEIFQRRNIIVHNDGVANKIYLARVAPELLESGIKDGSRLDVTEEYLNQAIDCVYLSGVMLIQLCWRKWRKETIDEADGVYINLLYETLQEFQYSLVEQIQDFSLKLEFLSDRNKRVTIINHAIALRELNQQDKMEKLLNTLDWSSSAIEFRVGLLALRKEKEALLKILPKAIASKELNRHHLEEWPLFLPFKEDADFIQFVESCPKEETLGE